MRRHPGREAPAEREPADARRKLRERGQHAFAQISTPIHAGPMELGCATVGLDQLETGSRLAAGLESDGGQALARQALADLLAGVAAEHDPGERGLAEPSQGTRHVHPLAAGLHVLAPHGLLGAEVERVEGEGHVESGVQGRRDDARRPVRGAHVQPPGDSRRNGFLHGGAKRACSRGSNERPIRPRGGP